MGGNGNGNDAMGVGGSRNLKTHSRTPLIHRSRKLTNCIVHFSTCYQSELFTFILITVGVCYFSVLSVYIKTFRLK